MRCERDSLVITIIELRGSFPPKEKSDLPIQHLHIVREEYLLIQELKMKLTTE